MSKLKEALIFKSSFDELESKGDPYIEKLEELNINCHPIKSIDFVFTNSQELTEKLESPDTYAGIVLTSPRCVAAVEKCSLDLQKWSNKRIFVIGERTGEDVITKLGLHPEGQSSGNAANLVSYILNQEITKPLLVPCGDLARDALSSALTKGGISVDKIVVYKTIPDPNLESSIRKVLNEYRISFIVCFSPSSINLSLPILQRNGMNMSAVEWIAIGPTTESCLLDYSLRVGCVAEKPTPESLAKAMKEFLG